jgi:hypothetical protein
MKQKIIVMGMIMMATILLPLTPNQYVFACEKKSCTPLIKIDAKAKAIKVAKDAEADIPMNLLEFHTNAL